MLRKPFLFVVGCGFVGSTCLSPIFADEVKPLLANQPKEDAAKDPFQVFETTTVSKLLGLSADLLSADLNKPIKFADHSSDVNNGQQRFSITLSGHVCDGKVCREVSDDQPTTTDEAAIAIEETSPPMPMLNLSRPKSVTLTDNVTVELQPPQASEVHPLQTENAVLKARIEAIENEIKLRDQHHQQILELTAKNSELSIEVAKLTATQAATQQLVDLLIQKTELSTALQAAQEFIGHEFAKKVEVSNDSTPFLVNMIESLRTDLQQAIMDEAAPKINSLPIPIAQSSYVPVYPDKATTSESEACPCEGNANGTCTEDCSTACVDCPSGTTK
jgi:hypothetical protein